MELTAESLGQVKFSAKMKGYDPDEVDKFIDEVTEAAETLHDRLRRSTERAAQAEQQLATVAANPPTPAAAPAASPNSDLGRIWERAVAAAESAIDEAKAEAKQILDEARNTYEETVGGAEREASRISAEAQAQLRAEITRLEGARDQLKGDVDGLGSFLDNEKSRLRATITNALSMLDDYGQGSSPPPEVNDVSVPSQPAPAPTRSRQEPPAPSSGRWAENGSGGGSSRSWEQPQESSYSSSNSWSDRAPADSQPAAPAWSAPSAPAPSPRAQEHAPMREDEEADPFLAELRRAVRDDGPLGPRDEEGDDDQDAIDRLYASDDDGNSFFKRKK